MSINFCTFSGRIGQTPRFLATNSGHQKLSFSIAVSERFKDNQGDWQERTEWVNCAMWNKQAQFWNERLDKGSHVFVQGALKNGHYIGKDGNKVNFTEVLVNKLECFDKKKATKQEVQKQALNTPSLDLGPDENEELPF